MGKQSDRAWTHHCEFPPQTPKTISLSSADWAGWLLKYESNSWTPHAAKGVGVYSENQCDPDFTIGVRVEFKVKAYLSSPTVHEGRNIIQTLDIEAKYGSQLPDDRTFLSWNFADFAIKKNWEN